MTNLPEYPNAPEYVNQPGFAELDADDDPNNTYVTPAEAHAIAREVWSDRWMFPDE